MLNVPRGTTHYTLATYVLYGAAEVATLSLPPLPYGGYMLNAAGHIIEGERERAAEPFYYKEGGATVYTEPRSSKSSFQGHRTVTLVVPDFLYS